MYTNVGSTSNGTAQPTAFNQTSVFSDNLIRSVVTTPAIFVGNLGTGIFWFLCAHGSSVFGPATTTVIDVIFTVTSVE